MAKTLTEQARLPGAASTDTSEFGDGSPVHSRFVFDFPRILNNLAAKCEPGFQFAYDKSAFGSGGPRVVYRVAAAGGGDGQVMLGQLPILVRPDAVRLCWSFGFYRDAVAAETPIDLNVINIRMYLAAAPCTHLADITAPSPNREDGRMFLPSFISGPYSSNTVVATGGSAATPTPCFTLVESTSWTDFMLPDASNVNDVNGDAWSYLIVTATITSGVTGERVRGAELGAWFDHE